MSLRSVFENQPERRYIMFGGKGGLGKTTLSAACAYWLASQGKRVLLFSVDPQASLSDIFQRDIIGKGPVPIMKNLWAQEVDADRRIKEYQDEIRQKILDMYGFERVPEEIDNYIAAASAEPAMEESAIFDAVVDIIVRGDYDYYIYDLVPLGHALYYLSMAEVYDEWINKITKLREDMRQYDQVAATMRREESLPEDQILAELTYIKDRINASSRILTDRRRTAFFFVVVPEEMIILDTKKAATLFARFDVPISGYVVNRVLPPELKTAGVPAYLQNRITMQDKYLGDIKAAFGAQVLAYVPEMERDVTGLGMIERLAGRLFVDGDDVHARVPRCASRPEVRVLRRQGRRRQDRHGGGDGLVARGTASADAPGLDQSRAQPVGVARSERRGRSHRGHRSGQPLGVRDRHARDHRAFEARDP